MDWYEIRDRIGAVEATPKQVYDLALSKGNKILAIKAYRMMKAEQGDRYYSLVKAKGHVDKIFEKRNHKKSYNEVLHYKLDDGSIITISKEKEERER